MTLPGKLVIGFLQEDNPIKAYFRFKPLLIEEESGFAPVPPGIEALYPEDGCIRIVPDKNEISHFKSRMRQLGRYCCMDLRKHPGENDKIRPNKNYSENGLEHNAHIVYSDVITAADPGALAEILDASNVFAGEEMTLRADLPGTPLLLVRRDGVLSGPWIWAPNAEIPGCITLRRAEGWAAIGEEAQNRLLTAQLDDMRFEVVYGLTPLAAAAPAPDLQCEAAAELVPEVKMEAPLPAEAQSAPAEARSPAEEPPKAPAAEKPWLSHDEAMRPRAVNRRLSLREQIMQAQSGINPRRGRSLHEVVDEQWRRSRYDQLGHPVPGEATGVPVVSPIERAGQAVREAWRHDAARPGLIKELLRDEDLALALRDCLGAPAAKKDAAIDEAANRLEADRLKLLGEIDDLRAKRADARAQLMRELREGRQQEFEQYERRNQALLAEVEQNERAAREAQEAAGAAQRVLAKSAQELEDALVEGAACERARALLRQLEKGEAPAAHPDLYDPTPAQLISDLRVQLARAGYELANDEAVNLLLCAMTGGSMILSGPPGAGKSGLARALAGALGLDGPVRRFAAARAPEDAGIERLLRQADALTPCAALLEDVNDWQGGPSCGRVAALQERAREAGAPLILLMTAQDAPEGQPLSARLLDRAFFVRLEGAPAQAEWRPQPATPPQGVRAPSLDALRRALDPGREELPGEVSLRMATLRRDLQKLGWTLNRRTLDETWRYTACACRLMTCAPLEALDWALSQRALPAMLAAMELEALHELPLLLSDMPRCLRLMDQPLPLPPLE